jgi:OmpA-OmpF porin, OOP family
MKAHLVGSCIVVVALVTQPSASLAQAPTAAASTSNDAQDDAPDAPLWRRHRPLPWAVEVGFYGGATWISDDHNLQDLAIVAAPGGVHRTFDSSPQWGVRAAIFLTTWVGVEGEFGFLVASTKPDGSADILAPRGHVVLQLPIARIVPFVLLGGGAYAMTDSTMGKDVDPAFHFGGGVKVNLTERVAFRLDLRDVLLQKNKLIDGTQNADAVHNGELLAGFSLTIGRTAEAPAPKDTDGDGIPDDGDRCPKVAANTPDGCPPTATPADTDGDGIPDDVDACPTAREDGLEPNPKDGCPSTDADKDTDGDGTPPAKP